MLKTILFVSVLSVSSAFADHHEEGEHETPACKAEVEKICKEAGGERKDKMKCVSENLTQFSAECQAKFEKMKEAFKEIAEACEKDMKELCADQGPGHGMMKCLKKNRKKLSESCKEKMQEHRKNHHKNKK